jgi:hypothetical protein
MPQKAIPLIFCILLFYSFVYNQQDDTDIGHFNTTSQKLVGDSYDLVSYFSENKNELRLNYTDLVENTEQTIQI